MNVIKIQPPRPPLQRRRGSPKKTDSARAREIYSELGFERALGELDVFAERIEAVFKYV